MSEKQYIDTPSGGFIEASSFDRAEVHTDEGVTYINVWHERTHVATFETPDPDVGKKFMADARAAKGLA